MKLSGRRFKKTDAFEFATHPTLRPLVGPAAYPRSVRPHVVEPLTLT